LPPVSEQVIVSLAILKVNWDQGRDYVANFLPFAGEALRSIPQRRVSLPDIQTALFDQFGLRIPQGALKTILNSAARQGYVTRDAGDYVKNEERLTGLSLSPARNRYLRAYEALRNTFIAFCGDSRSISWSPEQAEDALLRYLSRRSTDVLALALGDGPVLEARPLEDRSEYLVNTFVAHLNEKDPEGFEFIETVVKGVMLANVLYLPDLGAVSQRFENVEFYFDTPLLLKALGLDGDAPRAASRELLDLLYQQNALLRCFAHTRDELYGVLDASAHALRSGATGYGRTHEYLVRAGYRASDVELIIASLDRRLESLRVHVKPRPTFTASLSVDENHLEATLSEEVNYRRPEALHHDLDSLTSIHRLRQGETFRRIELCRAVFVTTNSGVVRAAVRIFDGEGVAASVPCAIRDHTLATLAWLKQPLEAPELPRKRILADCFAALNPSEALWTRYLAEIDRLKRDGGISEEDYHLLRYSSEARDALMGRTLGDASTFSGGLVEEILEVARASARAPAEAALATERSRREEAERRVAEAEHEIVSARKAAQAHREAQLNRVGEIAATVGRWTSKVVFYALTLTLLAAFVFTLPKPFPSIPDRLLTAVFPLVLFVLFALLLLSMANLVLGATVQSVSRRLEVRVSRRVERWLRKTIRVTE
jgi:hypothetical protein